MAVEFLDAPDVQAMAVRLIDDHHSHLAEARIKYLFRDGPWLKLKKETWGTAEKVTGKYGYLTGFDFIITINQEIWFSNIRYKPEAMEALVDHELQHCCRDEDEKTGDPIWYIQGHDVEDFVSVIRRHGLWSDALVKMHNAGNEFTQIQMHFEPEERLPQAAAGLN